MHKKGFMAKCFLLPAKKRLETKWCVCVCVCVCVCACMHACTATILPSSELNINGTVLVKVEHFKHLRAWLSHNLSWSKHVEEICKRASSFILRKHSSPTTLKQLYLSYVLPHLEYMLPQSGILIIQQYISSAIEKIQKFALRVYTKNWKRNYTQ